MARPDHLILGRITKVHGIRGEVKAVPYADGWGRFSRNARWAVGPRGGPFRDVQIQSATEHGPSVLLKFAGIDGPEAAASLVGQDVVVPRADAPALPDGTFYHYDILGLAVMSGGRELGTVEEILETPAHDVYVVRGPEGERLVPATRIHIRRIDLAAGCIELDPEAGLIEPST